MQSSTLDANGYVSVKIRQTAPMFYKGLINILWTKFFYVSTAGNGKHETLLCLTLFVAVHYRLNVHPIIAPNSGRGLT